MKIMRRVALAMALLPGMAMAQDGEPSDTEMKAVGAASVALSNGRYLDAAAMLRAMAFDAAGKPRPGLIYDQWAEKQTLMTGTPPPRPALAPGEPLPTPLPATDLARLRAAATRDAIATIVAGARNTRVVILNEDHGLPRDRAFGLEVARALRPLGYGVLAAETFANYNAIDPPEIARLARTGYATRASGYYTADPVFADFIRQSLALGYRPLAYEITESERSKGPSSSVALREEAQANHLAAALKADPTAKFLIYVGYSHATERPLESGERWMAGRLKQKTGIDPLTIDQTVLAQYPSYAPPGAWDAVADKAVGRSVVLFDGNGPLTVGDYAGAVDLQVVHPAERMAHGRPDWLATLGRTPTPIPAALLPVTGKQLVQAFVAAEGANAIPVDQILVTAGQTPPMLLLPAAPVRFAVQGPPPAR